MPDTLTKDTALSVFSIEQKKNFLYQMYLIRAFEEAAQTLYFAGKVHGTMHLSVGQEAVAVGSIAALRQEDYITSTHRGHGHAIAKGQNINEMMAELLAKSSGVCRGRGGSMHMADLNLGNLGANGIVAGGLPIAVGAGLSVKMQGQERVVICFFGDGAANAANFHESLNMASIWNLPVVFLCENNQYAMSMPARQSISVPQISDRAVAYSMPGETVDGMDLIAVYQATQRAVDRARRGDGPSLVEAVTYRYKGHSKSDKQAYRTKEEVQEWMNKDPINRFRAWLIEHNELTPAGADQIEAQAEADLEAAIAYAEAGSEPAVENLLRDVYTVEPEVEANPNKNLPAWIKQTFGPASQISPPPGAREITYAEALREAMAQAMEKDPAVFLIGEDIGVYGGAFGVTVGLLDRFGAGRVIDTPISENTIAGAAIGAGLTGMRPIAEMQFMDFVTLAMEQTVLQAAKIRYMFGGKASVSMVLRLPSGSGTGAAAQHSENLESWFVNVPGLKVVAPSTPYEAKGLLLAALADNDPVIFVEQKLLYRVKGPVPEEPYIIPIGQADIKRAGKDLTVVAAAVTVPRALEAAAKLAEEGIDLEVIDLRSLKPYDAETIIASVKRTGKLLVVHEAPKMGGFGGEIVSCIVESEAFDYLDAPIRRLGAADVPIPYNRTLEYHTTPQVEHIVEAARDLVKVRV